MDPFAPIGPLRETDPVRQAVPGDIGPVVSPCQRPISRLYRIQLDAIMPPLFGLERGPAPGIDSARSKPAGQRAGVPTAGQRQRP